MTWRKQYWQCTCKSSRGSPLSRGIAGKLEDELRERKLEKKYSLSGAILNWGSYGTCLTRGYWRERRRLSCWRSKRRVEKEAYRNLLKGLVDSG